MSSRGSCSRSARLAAACLAAGLLIGCGSSAPAPAPVTPGGAGAEARLPAFALEDQEGRAHRYAGTSETPVVIVVGNRHHADTNIAWDKWITRHYGGGVQLYRVVDLSGVAYLFKPIVVSRIRAAADPPGVPVLLDWDGWFGARLPLTDETSNVILVDREGRVHKVVAGAPAGEPAAAVAAALRRLSVKRVADA